MRRNVVSTMLTDSQEQHEHDKRLPRHSRAENCKRSDVPKHPGEAGRPNACSEKDQAGVPKAAGWSVAVGETTSRRQEAVAAGVGRCLLFLEGSVDNNKKRLLQEPPSLKKSMTNSIKFN